MLIQLAQKAQMALLVVKVVKILIKNSDFLDFFFKRKSFGLTSDKQVE